MTLKAKCPEGFGVEFVEKQKGKADCPYTCAYKLSHRCNRVNFAYKRLLPESASVHYPLTTGVEQTQSTTTAQSIATTQPQVATTQAQPTQTSQAHQQPVDDFVASNRVDLSVDQPQSTLSDQMYDDIFGTAPTTSNTATERSFGFAGRSYNSSKYDTAPIGEKPISTLDKYNDIANKDDLFNGIIVKPNEACIRLGSKIYHANPYDITDALNYIFLHWYTDAVFAKNGGYSQDFLKLIKSNYAKDSKVLKEIVDEPTDVNHKFYKLFSTVICKGSAEVNPNNYFYWSNAVSPIATLEPRYTDKRNFVDRLVKARDTSAFFAELASYKKEILQYLQSSDKVDTSDNWFEENLPLLIAEYTGEIIMLEKTGDGWQKYSMGRIADFAQCVVTTPRTMEEMNARYKFFKNFTIVDGTVVKRSSPFSMDVTETDDSVYKLVVPVAARSQSASYFNMYLSVLYEYVTNVNPTFNSLTIAGITFTSSGFDAEVRKIMDDAYAHFFGDKSLDDTDVRGKFFLVKSLLDRGIFEKFERYNEHKNFNALKQLFCDKPSVKQYFAFEKDLYTHKLVRDGRLCRVKDYISANIQQKIADVAYSSNSVFDKDEVAQTYLELHVKGTQTLRDTVFAKVSEADKSIQKFTSK